MVCSTNVRFQGHAKICKVVSPTSKVIQGQIPCPHGCGELVFGYQIDGAPAWGCQSMKSYENVGKLVGGFKHVLFSILYGMSSFPLNNIFQDVKTTNK